MFTYQKLIQSAALSLLLAGLSSQAFAQTNTSGYAGQENLRTLGGSGGNVITRFDQRYSGVKGNPFYLDVWLDGAMELRMPGKKDSTRLYRDLKLKYDAYRNEVIAVQAGKTDTLAFHALQLASFTLQLPQYKAPVRFRTYPEAKALDGKLENTFFAVVYDGKTDFLKRIGKKLVKADYQGAYSSGQTYDEITDEVQYYLVADGKMQKVKLTKKSVLEALPKQEEKLKAYISAQKLALNKEEDLVKVLAYYDTL